MDRLDPRNATLEELIAVLNDGIGFYQQASVRSEEYEYILIYQKIRRLKEKIVDALKSELQLRGGHAADEGSWLGNFRKNYADLRASVASDPEHVYIAALEAQEDRVMRAFHGAMGAETPTFVRSLAARYLPEIQYMHDQLRDLKRQTEKRSLH